MSPRPFTLPVETRSEIARLYQIGVCRKEIARRTGTTIGQIKNVARRGRLSRRSELFALGVAEIANPGEHFIQIIDFPDYWVSDFGRVISMKIDNAGTMLQPYLDKDGYERVHLIGRVTRHRHVHILVAEAFLGPKPSPKHQIAHGDGSRRNNRLANLRWDTSAGNHADKLIHGTAQNCERHARALYSNDQVIPIKKAVDETARTNNGKMPKGSCLELARMFGVSVQLIYDLSRVRQSWRLVG